MAILHRRINDDHIPARKSAISAFSKLILVDNTFATKKNLKVINNYSPKKLSLLKFKVAEKINNFL